MQSVPHLSATVPPSVPSLTSRLVCCCAVLLAVGLILTLYGNLHRGMEWSDEGLYLASIQHPENLLSTPSDFGAFLHPLYNALGKDIYALRVMAFSLLLVLGGALALGLNLVWHAHARHTVAATATACAVLTSATCAYYVNWTPTPSYNWMALSGMYAVFAALLGYSTCQRPRHCRRSAPRYAALTLLALGGLVAFIGKGTTGAGLGLLALMWMLYCGGPRSIGQRLKDALYPAVLALLLLTVYLFGISHGLDTVKKILLYAAFMDNTYGLTQTLAFYSQYFLPLSYLPVLATYPLWLGVIWALHTERRCLAAVLAAGCTLYMLILSLVLPTTNVMGLCVWPLFCAALVAAALWRRSWRHFRKGSVLGAMFFLGVFLYHAGTNTEVEFKLTEAFVLPCAAIISVLSTLNTQRRIAVLPATALILCCMTWAALSTTFTKTFRHNGMALWQLTEAVEMTPGTRPLLTHPARQAFVHWLRATASAHGWRPGTPLLNTSYYTSTSLFLLDARKVAASWQIEQRYTPMERYPHIFGQVPSDVLRAAWILKPAEDGPRHMPATALPLLGLPFPEGYELLGISPPEALNGVWPAARYELWKPLTQ